MSVHPHASEYFNRIKDHAMRMYACGNFGIFLEEKMLNAFSSMGIFSNIQHENDLRKQYGFDAASIDYVLEVPEGYIVTQIKWRGSRRRENNSIANFLKSLDYIKTVLPQTKPVLFGIWACRIEPFQDNQEMLRKNNIVIVHNYTDIEGLVTDTQTSLKAHLGRS